MKKLLSRFMLLFFIASVSSVGNAETVGEYDSNGVTTFYGTYEHPTEESSDELPPKPNHPQSIKPAEPSGTVQKNTSGEIILPATGDDHMNKIQLLGIGIVLVGVGTLFILRREKYEKNNRFNDRNHFIQ